MSSDRKSPIECVGVICFRGDEVLLIRRGTPPRQGEWSIPGGRIEKGESEREAALRELFEETGVFAELLEKVDIIEADFDRYAYRLHDYRAAWIKGDPKAGDDALEARFVPMSDLDTIHLWSETRKVIEKAFALHESLSPRT